MKRKNGLFAFGVLLLIGISISISSCEKKDPPEPDPEASSIQSASGNSQSAEVGQVLANPVEVVVKDQDGKVFPGAAVSFAVTEGSVSPTTAKTDASGKAKTSWTLGTSEGPQTLIVTAFKADGTTKLSGSPITFTATATQKKATSIELVDGEDQTADAGTVLANSIKILVKDQNGDAFAGAAVNFAVTEGSVSSASEITDANGNASVSWTLGSTVGTQALTVTAFKADGTTALTGSPITVNATCLVKEAASIELVSGGDQSAVANNTLAEYIVFIVKDASGNPFVGVKVNFSITEGNLGATGNSTVTDADGLATIRWTMGSTVGTQTLSVTAFKADGTSHLTGSPLVVNATATGAVAERIRILAGDNQTGKANTFLLTPIKIHANGYGNNIEGQTVYFDVTEGSVSPVSGVTDANGLISTIWTLGPTTGTQTLTVTSFEADGTTHLDNSPLLVNATAEAGNETGTVTDVDGNVYQTVKIGEQWWMAENLKVTHLPDGTAITKVTGDTDWAALSTTDNAYCWVNNIDNSEYGVLYTRNAALNGAGSSTTNPSGIQGVCPDGWHMPSEAEWTPLTYLHTTTLKEPGTEHWLSPSESNNETGFTALGSGYRSFYSGGVFKELNKNTYWWASNIYSVTGKGVAFRIGYYNALDYGLTWSVLFNSGRSVRCVKD
ncbi:MAG: hypothetical protein DRI73_02690 [Bacteroidetes bacterium]|nr:MAG: hypothetical protein DRI73_02690 [Bacteroidota bacterium]